MHPHKTRYVAVCQQLLVVGAVIAALVPAAGVVTLDIVRQTPLASETTGAQAGALAAYIAASETPSLVPTSVVDPIVNQIPLTTAVSTVAARTATQQIAARVSSAVAKGSHVTANATLVTRTARIASGTTNKVVTSSVLTSTPQSVTGYGTVGVTWEHGDDVTPAQVGLQVRTETGGVWGDWQAMDFDADGPDANSPEGRRSRPGTMESLVGHVDQVQVRMTATGVAVPPDMKLAVIDPGTPTSEAEERPAIDTNRLDTSANAAPDQMTPADDATPVDPTDPSNPVDGSDPSQPSDGVTLSGADVTPEPQIYSRAQWGADESLKRSSTPSYGEVEGGFVHHTVDANDYTAAEVPAILRSIYAYHVKGRGWNDIGYNYLIDKFGRIWEGRYGGVDRPVIGAHTESYNYYSFGVSAIGNYDIAKPPAALIQAEGAIFAWKLSLHGVSAAATNVTIGPRTFASSIMAHRDTKATACPGRYLYARMGDIRTLASSLQHGWSGRDLDSNLAGPADPDLIVRRASDGEGFVVPTNTPISFGSPTALIATPAGTTRILSPDLGHDHVADLVVVDSAGTGAVIPGVRSKGFSTKTIATKTGLFAGSDLLAAGGDVTGNGTNDLVGRDTSTGKLVVFAGNGKGGFTLAKTTVDVSADKLLVGPGDVTGDKHGDLLALDTTGQLWLYRGRGHAKFYAPTLVAGSYSGYKSIHGGGDFTGDGIGDLLVSSASTGAVAVLPANGTGGFGSAVALPALKGISLLGAGQLDGSGVPEIYGGKNSHIVVASADGKPSLGTPIDTGLSLVNANLVLNAGDWDGDGFGDIIVRSKKGVLSLYRGDGTGHFTTAAIRLSSSSFAGVSMLTVAGDITGDGLPDLQGQLKTGSVWIWPGKGATGLGKRYVSHSTIAGTAQISVGRWDADGAPDNLFRLSNGSLVVYRGNGPGGLLSPTSSTPRISTNVSAYDWVIGTSDVDGDTHPDLVVRNPTTGALYELPGRVDGSLGTPIYLGSGMGAYDLAG